MIGQVVVETIKIVSTDFPDGLIINKSDFNPEIHTEFGVEPEVKKPIKATR